VRGQAAGENRAWVSRGREVYEREISRRAFRMGMKGLVRSGPKKGLPLLGPKKKKKERKGR